MTESATTPVRSRERDRASSPQRLRADAHALPRNDSPRGVLLADRYEIVSRIAAGGMAEVFLAFLHGAAGYRKPVALKRILPHVANDEAFVEMFLDEAQTAARICHPHICEVFELFEDAGEFYLSMELLEGTPLRAILNHCADTESPMPPRIVAGLLYQTCTALTYAHELVDFDGHPAGLVHRDLTPSNIFVTTNGFVKVLDFGIAKAKWVSSRTQTGVLKGNAAYMSPEQVRGQDLDHRSDIFSLGISGFEMFANRRLFQEPGDYDTLKAVISKKIPKLQQVHPGIPFAIADTINKALSRGLQRRFQSAREFAAALKESTPNIAPPIEIAAYLNYQHAKEIETRRRQFGRHLASDASRAISSDESITDNWGVTEERTAILVFPSLSGTVPSEDNTRERPARTMPTRRPEYQPRKHSGGLFGFCLLFLLVGFAALYLIYVMLGQQ